MTWSQENCLIDNHCYYLRVMGKGLHCKVLVDIHYTSSRISLPLSALQEGVS